MWRYVLNDMVVWRRTRIVVSVWRWAWSDMVVWRRASTLSVIWAGVVVPRMCCGGVEPKLGSMCVLRRAWSV